MKQGIYKSIYKHPMLLPFREAAQTNPRLLKVLLSKVFICTVFFGFFIAEYNLFAAPCPSDYAVTSRFKKASDHYATFAFDEVLKGLTPLVDDHCFTDQSVLQTARLLLGISHMMSNQQESADAYFLQLLRADPDVVIAPALAPGVVLEHIEELRSENSEELDEIRQHLQHPAGGVIDNFWLVIETERRQFWVNFLPFGAGSFQNERSGWGTGFALTQGLALGMNLTGLTMVELLRGETHTFSFAEAEVARNWQTIQNVGSALFIGSYLWGVIDGIIFYEQEVRTFQPPREAYPEDLLEESRSELQWGMGPWADSESLGLQLLLVY